MVSRRSTNKSADVISEYAPFHRPMCRRTVDGSSLDSKVIGRRSADRRPIVQFCDFLSESVRTVFNVIASVGRQIDVFQPIKIQKSYRPTVFFNVIAA